MPWQAHTRITEITSILLIFVLGCTLAHSMTHNTPNSITITEKDNGGEVQVTPGCILILKLEAIPGTGYAWQMVRNAPELLKPLGESFFEPIVEDTGEEKLGAPENQVFRFMAQRSGTTSLELHYIREWEKEVAPLKTFRITVQIH